MAETIKRLQKVTKFQIIKPVNMDWSEFGKILRDVRYRLWRLANMAVNEQFLNFYQRYRLGNQNAPKNIKIGQLSRDLRKHLSQEKNFTEESLSKYSKTCALPDTVTGAFYSYKFSAINWKLILSGKMSVPNYKQDISIPIRCDKPHQRRLEKTNDGEIEVELMVCGKPYPRVLLSTAKISDGERAILERLVSNKTNSLDSYRQRFFEIKEKNSKWFLHVCYDFPKSEIKLNRDIIVGVDLGWSVPLYAAISNGYARIGYKKLKVLGDNIKSLRKQTIARRRSIQNSGIQDLAAPTARSGHGRRRILQPIEKLENKIDNAYTTLNHQLSHCVIEFAKNNGAGLIQIENLKGLKDELSGTFIGQNWRYYQLQNYIKYKAEEAGIEVKEVNPFYTSRRCSDCGHIHKDFDREYRDKNRKDGKSAMFGCPRCSKEKKDYKPLNADYNAARNLATADIVEKIRLQCKEQGIEYRELPKD